MCHVLLIYHSNSVDFLLLNIIMLGVRPFPSDGQGGEEKVFVVISGIVNRQIALSMRLIYILQGWYLTVDSGMIQATPPPLTGQFCNAKHQQSICSGNTPITTSTDLSKDVNSLSSPIQNIKHTRRWQG